MSDERSDPDIVTAQVVAARLGIRERRLRQLRETGQFPPPLRIGGSIRWRWSQIQKWIEAMEIVQTMSPGLLRSADEVAAICGNLVSPSGHLRQSAATDEKTAGGKAKKD